jgi:hypothetical protein
MRRIIKRVGAARRLMPACYAVLGLAAIAQGADGPVLLHVEGDVKTSLALTGEDLAKMPRTTASFERDGDCGQAQRRAATGLSAPATDDRASR